MAIPATVILAPGPDKGIRASRSALALRLAGQAAAYRGLAAYSADLIAYAKMTARGDEPSRTWQLTNLGHLIGPRKPTT